MCWAYRTSYSITIIFIMFGAVIHYVGSIDAVLDIPNCHQSERQALLSFKHHLTDPSDRLLSWAAGGICCCGWHGIVCDNLTGHVLELLLRGPFSVPEYQERIIEGDWISKLHWLGGKLDSSLLDLKYLHYLDLSNNDFGGIQIPLFVGSMHSLTYLNLSVAGFGGEIPSQLGNLSNLLSLDITDFHDIGYGIRTKNLGWLSGLSMLRYLDLSYVMHLNTSDALQGISALPLLEELHLQGCGIENISHIPNLVNVNFSNLVSLDLSSNQLNGALPHALGQLHRLEYLDLSENAISSQIPDALGSLNSLLRLDFSYNQLNGILPQALGQLHLLEYLSLENNLICGVLPESLGSLSSLVSLVLSGNKFSGALPASLGKLIQLETLDVSFNSLEGFLTPLFFANLTSLKYLSASANRIQVSPDWIPPLQLQIVHLSSCYLGPKFPKWISSLENLKALDISSAGINDTVPGWFWNMTPQLECLNMSHNHLHGKISNIAGALHMGTLDLSYNLFSGHIKSLFRARKNELGGLVFLHLGNNNLFGEIPDCWSNWPYLKSIELQNNNLFGSLPKSLESLSELKYLHLRNNSFSGVLPASLQNCTELLILDIGDNKLSGVIPKWIGRRLSNLRILSLGLNYFDGYIPNELCGLSSLVILDMAHNNLSGAIPNCFANFSAMTKQSDTFFTTLNIPEVDGENLITFYEEGAILVTKALVLEYSNNLQFMTAIDLSNNSLSGPIPENITNLMLLRSLNLSGNFLTGKIPENIGHLSVLESLDLSMNRLSGEIPQSMASMTFLSFLNVSFNDLVGRIPTGTQIQGFDASRFIGNKLCGPPVSANCEPEGPEPNKQLEDNQHDGLEYDELYVSFSLGYIVGLGAVIAPLLYSTAWRPHYFRWLHRVDCLSVLNLICRSCLKMIVYQRRRWLAE